MVSTLAIGKRTDALDMNIAEVKRYREFDCNWLLDSNLREGDKIIVSGYIGDHGVALLSFREGFGFDTELKSDITPLNRLIHAVLEVGGVVAMKDPTRGGFANLLNEFSEKSNCISPKIGTSFSSSFTKFESPLFMFSTPIPGGIST